MILAIMRAQALTTARDRGALIMTFVLPPLLFLLFASIFSGAGGDTARVTVAAARAVDAPAADALIAALAAAPDLDVSVIPEDEVAKRVADGAADVGLIVRGDPAAATERPPLVVLSDPGRAVAGSLLLARLNEVLGHELPGIAMRRVAAQIQVLVGAFTPEQKDRLEQSVAKARELVEGGGADLVERRPVARLKDAPTITYYAGAIAMLFLLFTAVLGAASLVDERRSGVFDRVVMAKGGLLALVTGKMAFLVLQGLALSAVLLAVAQIAYGVPALAHGATLAVVSLAAAAAAAGIALPIAAAAQTRHQAQTLSTFAVLLVSAVGGSMVPRFLMPHWLQQAGALTPTAWGIEAFQGALWRGDSLAALLPSLAALLIFAVAGWVLAVALVHRSVRLG
ncbi:ABC transporter permease [Xanthobacter pseudotagetidis]|uniref:ABC transporter permease n=1 Tax=Xanthobacter pseudotagetidis TaxID=3119911 RepID=UPI00372C2468